MEGYKANALRLVAGLALEEKKDPTQVPYYPQKTVALPDDEPTLPRRICGKKHKYAARLASLLSALEEESRAKIHSIIAVKDGEVILEAAAPGYSVHTPHLAHSMSKTIAAIAIGLLVDDGKLSLDEKVTAFFPEEEPADARFADMTVEDLLTMRSGVPFSEVGVVSSDKWTEDFFESPLRAAPGEVFSYNSMNSYILARIVTRVSGLSVTDFITPRLLMPLGITSFFWELSPEGCEKGGFGVYMSAESFAKIGIMLLSGGKWGKKQILSKRFITKMLLTHALAPTEKGDFNYGYHVWVSRDGSDFLLSGMLGQNVWVNPENNLVVALNSGNNEIFQNSPALAIIRERLSNLDESAVSTPADYKRYKAAVRDFFESRRFATPEKPLKGLLYKLRFKDSEPFDINWEPVLGSYVFPDNNLGLLPLFTKVLQNNYSGGIEEISIERGERELFLISTEGGVKYEYPIGLYGYRETTLDFAGEKYRVLAAGEAALDEFDTPVYRIELVFPEIPNTRYITITEEENGIKLRLSESPSERVAAGFIENMDFSGLMGFAMGALEKRLGENFILARLTAAFNPEISGVDKRITDVDDIISEKNRELNLKKESSGKLIKTLVSRIASEKKPEVSEPKSGGGFLSRAWSNIKSKMRGKKNVSNAYDISLPHEKPASKSDNVGNGENAE